MRRSAALRFALVAWLVPTLALAGDTWTTPHPGIRRLHRTTSSPTWNINALVVDLNAPGIKLSSTPYALKGRRTSAYATAVGAQAAINGDFYNGSFVTTGLSVGDGQKWPGTADDDYNATLEFNRDTSRVELSGATAITTAESWMWGVVSGHPMLVANGGVRSFSGTFCTARHPRTAAGLSQDCRTLYVAVVDGRQSSSVGMTCLETATLMDGLGAHTAVNLDGGGSSTMWVRGTGIINKPSDGSERTVANHLAIFAGQPASTGTLIGAVYKHPNTADRLPGATVKLQDGTSTTADATGVYRFNLPAGSYTATATIAGYSQGSATRTVASGQTIWGSIGLTPTSVPVDSDADGKPDASDNCPELANPDQLNTDGDADGDACDGDDDGDGAYDEDDNCPLAANEAQANRDGDDLGDACDPTDDTPVDAGTPEVADAGPVELDAGPTEAPDAGSVELDAGPTETPDAGSVELDAGPTEAPDAGTTDTPDAQDPPHTPSRAPSTDEGGCTTVPLSALLLLGLAALRRRRA